MTTRLVRCATAVAAAAMLAGCAETGADEDSYGSLAAAVTATGEDGATYRLPAGTWVQVWNGTFYDSWLMDGDATVVSVEVPVGDYYVSIAHADGYTVEWPLDRTNPDATTETVNSTLLTPQPVSVTVTEGAVSTLVFQFQVVNGGTVTFAHGVIDISIDVDVTESTVGRAMFSGNYVKSYESVGPTAPPELAALLPATGDTVFHQIRVNVLGDWVQNSSNSACSSVQLVSGIVSLSLFDVTREAWYPDASAQLCVYGNVYAPFIYISSSRSGAALTPNFQALGDYQFYFQQAMSTTLPDAVFDGETLDLGALTGTFDLAANLTTSIFAMPTGGSAWENWYNDGNDGSSVTFEFVPTL